ncbi:MAG TPA: GAF domain-containing protein [Bacteroidia bacterium]|nr:GAF domain-containing protein [Bacteroidia bacterium]
MSESLIISGATKEARYQSLLPQIKALVEGEKDFLANLANITSALKYGMNWFWVGFYFVKENNLVLGPFQGTVACTRITFGKGVCGKSWAEKKIILVENVNDFPGHIACSSDSQSEIVLPVFNQKKEVIMVLDIDSDQLAAFDKIDAHYLQELVTVIEKLFLKTT